MKNHLLILLAIISFLSLSNEVQATHVMGSDIIYRCLGNGVYEITLRVYRDCNGVQLSNSPVGARCLNNNGSTSFSPAKISQRDITGIDAKCPVQSRCSGSYQYGVEEHIWKGTINLSSLNCCEVELNWQQCCRNSNISTGQANQNFYTTAVLNKCVSPCNSSPDFTNPPVALICVNQDFVFNNGALDTVDQGDSLSFELVKGLQGAGNPVTYSGQFSEFRPLTFLGFPNQSQNFPAGFRLDPLTGDLMFRPTKQNEVAIIVIEVQEWRRINGTMEIIGRTRRDMQIIVIPCPNNKVPRIRPPYSAQACAGQEVCLDIRTEDDDQADTVRISWNRGIPGATFTNNNGTVRHASGKVCWTPTDKDVSNIPYTFTITARDDACPIAGQSIRAFQVFVRETPKAKIQIDTLSCGRIVVDFTLEQDSSKLPGFTASWEFRDSLNFFKGSSNKKRDTVQVAPGLTAVVLRMQTTVPCLNEIRDTVIIAPYVTVSLPADTFVCTGDAFNIQATGQNGKQPYKWLWSTGNKDTLDNVTVKPANDTNFYSVRITDDNKCNNTDTIMIRVLPRPFVNLGPDQRICQGGQAILDAGNDTVFLTYLWSNNDTSRTSIFKEQGTIWVQVKDSIGCPQWDSMLLNVNQVPVDGGPNIVICFNEAVNLEATGADSYQWFESGNSANILSNTAKYSFLAQNNRRLVVRGTKTEGGLTCINFDTVQITVNPLPNLQVRNDVQVCLSQPTYTLNLMLQGNTPNTGTWSSPVNSAWVVNGQFQVQMAGANPNPGHAVRYTFTDQNGCTQVANTTLRVNPLPNVRIRDTSLCGDIGNFQLNRIISLPVNMSGGISDWSQTPQPQRDAISGNSFAGFNLDIGRLQQGNTYMFIYRFTDDKGCANFDTADIRVKTVPVVNAGTLPEVCADAAPVNLLVASNATPGGGVWSPIAPSNLTNNTFDPAIVPNKNNVRYWFRYTVNQEGCVKWDSASILVKPVPTVTATTSQDNMCINNNPVDLIATPGASPPNGIWTGPGINGLTFEPQTAGAGTHLLRYDYTHPITGCTNFATTSVFVQALPTITVTSSPDACTGFDFQLQSTVGVATGIIWKSLGDGQFIPDATSASTAYRPGAQDNIARSFIITGTTTGNGLCPAAEQILNVRIYPTPSISIIAEPMEGCEPLLVEFRAITDADPVNSQFTWDFGDPASSDNSSTNINPSHLYNRHGAYRVNLKIISENGCDNTATPQNIVVHPVPEAKMDASRWLTTLVVPGIQFYDLSTVDAPATIAKRLWSFGDPLGSFSTQKDPFFNYPNDTGTYLVTLRVETEKGCWDTTTRPLIVEPDISVFIPNAFSPNNLGVVQNNRFYVTADGFIAFNIQIYNRWGERVYESDNISEGWDGNYKGQTCQQDVYMYVVRVISFAGKEFNYYGTVTLLR